MCRFDTPSSTVPQWAALLLVILLPTALLADDTAGAVSFNRDVRPILSDKCLNCHGPDSATREAELRLDDEQGVRKSRGDYHILVPGQPQQSELFRRIISSDEDEVMPPHDSGRTLSADEIELLRKWIEQGGKYQRHWSFISPVRAVAPDVTDHGRVINDIDAFVLSRLQRERLKPSVPADRPTLLRRVSLDLTGLPPTLTELEEFLNDSSEDAYERVVDRLLQSPQFGEQMTRHWLDAARYADTNGFFVDSGRAMWRWRDWVINAFNDNMPFDRFTIEQLAGDLIPNATLDQQIASGFNRNHMTTIESGAVDEEYRVEYVVDRLHTTATTWLGLTVGCARCHDHKFDPISQKEFFGLFAFFNNVPERGVGNREGNSVPLLQVPSKELQQQIALQKDRLAQAEATFKTIESDLDAVQLKWEQATVERLPMLSTDQLVAWFPLDGNATNFGSLRVEATPVGNVQYKPGMLGQAVALDGDAILEFREAVAFDRESSFSIGAWIKPSPKGPVCILSKNDDVNKLRGFDLMIRKGYASVHLIHEWNSNAIEVHTKVKLPNNRWQHLLATYDGSSSASGVKIYIDGNSQELQTRYDSLSGSIQTSQPLRIGRRSTSAAYNGLIDDVRIYGRELSAEQVKELFTTQLIQGIATIPREKRTTIQKTRLRSHFLTTAESADFQRPYRELLQQRVQLRAAEESVPDVMVMRDTDKVRDTFVLIRGQYDQPGEQVSPDVPASLPPFPEDATRDRLGFAQWLMHPSNPLTARVAVNRLWQQLFGTGLVKTSGDFGSQGAWPSHPELLDWLAVEFQKNSWNTKHVLKRIVMSSTYRQSSRATKERLDRDPENRLLARGPRFRLDAESIRDNALAISGLLRNKIGGPSVKPYQPAGLWEAVSYGGDLTYEQDEGDSLYRRSLYTYWKRQSPPPALMAFDAPTRETCSVRRARTNTPLQALVLMNDTTYVEAARVLAQRMMKHRTDDPRQWIEFAFRLATARQPAASETDILLETFHIQRQRFRMNPSAAEQLVSLGGV